jgi:hypothetical protein
MSHHQANLEPLKIFECVVGSCSPLLEVKTAPRQKAIHYLLMGQRPLKQKEL